MTASFHPLTVDRVEPLTADSAAITLSVPDDLTDVFAFAPGQFLTVGRGTERRSYSICAPAGAPPRIGVREVPGGALSAWLVREVRPGDVLEVAPPAGRFTPDLTAGGRHAAIAAGSGITPVLSIAASVLAASPDSEFTLLYGNRRSSTVMFADDIADLKDAYPARMRTVHVLSREPQEIELFSGRLDAGRLKVLLPSLADPDEVDHWWLCGPYGLVTGASAVLGELGVAPRRVRRELFWVEDEPPAPAAHQETSVAEGAAVTITLDGRSTAFTLPAGTPVLDGAQRVRPGMPFACKGGVCGTCRARVTAGSAVMRRNYALEDDETSAGYVLTCQALPTSGELAVDYDA